MEFEVTNETQREQAMRKMVQRGATVVLGVGFAQADAINAVAGGQSGRPVSPLSTSAGSTGRTCANTPSAKSMRVSYLVGVAAAMASAKPARSAL